MTFNIAEFFCPVREQGKKTRNVLQNSLTLIDVLVFLIFPNSRCLEEVLYLSKLDLVLYYFLAPFVLQYYSS